MDNWKGTKRVPYLFHRAISIQLLFKSLLTLFNEFFISIYNSFQAKIFFAIFYSGLVWTEFHI